MHFLFLLCIFASCLPAEEHRFSGQHFVASYLECDQEALSHVSRLLEVMDEAVVASHATILARHQVLFEPDGLTAVYLLSESHASIHTYPEHRSCFVDLFTCGTNCSAEPFDRLLRSYLKPERVNARMFLRHESTVEIP